MGELAAVAVFGMFLLIWLASYLIPKEKPPRKPDWTAEYFDRRRP